MRSTSLADGAGGDLLDSLPGVALPGGAALFVGLLLALHLLSDRGSKSGKGGKKSAADRSPSDEAIETGARVIGRFLSGRELDGKARSDAGFWRAGVPLPVDGKRLRTRRGWSCWPYGLRAAVRLAVPAAAAGLWFAPERTRTALVAVAVFVVLAVASGPAGLGWWGRRGRRDDQTYGPALWVALRQILRVEESEPWRDWLTMPRNLKAPEATIRLRLPVSWLGGKEGQAAVEYVLETRLPGDWDSRWELGPQHEVTFTPRPMPTPKPSLPVSVPWSQTGNRHEVFIGWAVDGDKIVDAVVRIESDTPHWGVAGGTGSGKSTALYIPIVHARQWGELVDILDTKQNSLKNAEGHSGVRVHKTPRECIAALGEFLVSMMAAESAQQSGAQLPVTDLPHPRTLVVDELPTLIKTAWIWWRHGLKGKGQPPFLDWLVMILLQGRSANHRVVIGTQQFANDLFGGTMGRDQIGTKVVIGYQEDPSWRVAFGAGAPRLQYDDSVKGRGAFTTRGEKRRRNAAGEVERVREIQLCNIAPDVGPLLGACELAPEWFDAGGMAPWITAEVLAEAHAVAAVGDFLGGGRYAPQEPVTGVTLPATGGGVPSSAGVTARIVTPAAADGVTADQDAPAPEVYTLPDACARDILPLKAATARQYKKRSAERGIAFPEGVQDGTGKVFYTEAELRDWWTEWQAHARKEGGTS